MKNKMTALLLSILLGGFGVDRFYLGYTDIGLLKLFTGGVFGVLYILDIIHIATGELKPADGSDYEDEVSHNTKSTTAVEELQKIKELYSAGLLSDTEYETLRKKYIDQI